MRWLIIFLLPLAALTGFVGADQPSNAEVRLRQLRRDLPLIESLVEAGLKLAAEAEPLQRVESCHRLADGFAVEMRKAVVEKDGARVLTLSENLKALLERGIALNLGLARKQLPMDGGREKDLQRASEQVLKVIMPLEEQLELPDNREQQSMQTALKDLAAARGSVESAATSKASYPKR